MYRACECLFYIPVGMYQHPLSRDRLAAQPDTDPFGLDAPVEGLDTHVEGHDVPIEGLDTPADCLDAQVEGLDTPAEGLDAQAKSLDTPPCAPDIPAKIIDTPGQRLGTDKNETYFPAWPLFFLFKKMHMHYRKIHVHGKGVRLEFPLPSPILLYYNDIYNCFHLPEQGSY